ncbi:hypothetical protein [Microcoleus sp. AR_TQ3_B6]|uniref:hypothetical protein n=1 Tax=Microcoleus sp. AR_TQ3_B6 TaxID=3055284 RepID=UPI002FD1C492
MDTQRIEMWQQVRISETEGYASLVPLDRRESKAPVQPIYRGLRQLSLGKWRNLAREQPGNPGSDSWEAYTIIFDLVQEDVTSRSAAWSSTAPSFRSTSKCIQIFSVQPNVPSGRAALLIDSLSDLGAKYAF